MAWLHACQDKHTIISTCQDKYMHIVVYEQTLCFVKCHVVWHALGVHAVVENIYYLYILILPGWNKLKLHTEMYVGWSHVWDLGNLGMTWYPKDQLYSKHPRRAEETQIADTPLCQGTQWEAWVLITRTQTTIRQQLNKVKRKPNKEELSDVI